MPTMCYLNFPAIEIKTATDSILYAVSKYVTGKFPQRIIKQTFIDTSDKMRDIYKNALKVYSGKVSENNNYEEMLKVQRPHLFVGYTFDSSFDSTETGLGETQPYMFPNAFFLQEHQQSAFPIFIDNNRKISIKTSNLRIRVTAEFTFTCSNREEQFTIYNYILNTLKMYYTMPLNGIKASFIMPDSLITFVKDALYGEETKIDEVRESLGEYLKKGSAGDVYPVFKNNKEKDNFFELKYHYRQVDFRLTGKPQMDEGEKTGEAPDNFLVRFPAEVQFYIPTNYTIKLPELVPNGEGNIFEVPNAIKLDAVNDNDLNDHVLTVIKRYEDIAYREPSLYEKGFDFALRSEFAIMNPEDYFNIQDVLDDSLKTVFNFLTPDERLECFKFYIYENGRMLDKDKFYTMDDDWNIFIHEGDILKGHEIEIYLKTDKINEIIDKRKR